MKCIVFEIYTSIHYLYEYINADAFTHLHFSSIFHVEISVLHYSLTTKHECEQERIIYVYIRAMPRDILQ